MAKTSMVNREAKREKLAKKYGAKRDALKKIIASATASSPSRPARWASSKSWSRRSTG